MITRDDPIVGDLPLLIRFGYASEYFYDLESRETAAGFSWSLIRRPASPPIAKEHRWMPFEDAPPNARGYVALVDGEPAGYVECALEEFTNLVRVLHLYVRQGSRRMGVGTKLLEGVEQAARHFRARGVVIETQTGNVPAIQFYQSMGYTFWGVNSAFYTNDDVAKRDVRVDLGKTL